MLSVELAGIHGACFLLGGLCLAAALLLGLPVLSGIQGAIEVFLKQAAVRTDHGQDGVHVVLGVRFHLELRTDLLVVLPHGLRHRVLAEDCHGEVLVCLRKPLGDVLRHAEVRGFLEGDMKREPLAKVAVVELGNRLGGHDFLALHRVVRSKVLQGGLTAGLHVLLLEPVADLPLGRGLAQVIEQADAATSPFRLLVQLHLAELGLLVWIGRHDVALAAALGGEVPLAELGAEELQHHLGLQRPVAHEDGGGDAHGVSVVVEPLLAGRVRELANVLGDVGAE